MMNINFENTITSDASVEDKIENFPLNKMGHETGYGHSNELSKSFRGVTGDSSLQDLTVQFAKTNLDEAFEDKSDGPVDNDSDSDSADKEVEELLSHALTIRKESHNCCNANKYLRRPSAPLPNAAAFYDGKLENVHAGREDAFDKQYIKLCRHNKTLKLCKLCSQYHFRPINSVSTEIGCSDGLKKNNHSMQEISLECSSEARAHESYALATGNPIRRPSGETSFSTCALPDVVPRQIQRPHSLPDIVTLRQHYENEMGRELRRIGDEFETRFRERNIRKVQTVSWSVFNCSVTFHLSGYLNTLRQMLSPTPSETLENR